MVHSLYAISNHCTSSNIKYTISITLSYCRYDVLVPRLSKKKRHFGSAKGLIVMAEDFDAGLPDFRCPVIEK